MSGQTVSMSFVATRLSRYLEHPVVDHTGLEGTFDFKLDPPTTDSANNSTHEFQDGIFESVEKLGLRLNRSKAKIDSIAIDQATKPSEN